MCPWGVMFASQVMCASRVRKRTHHITLRQRRNTSLWRSHNITAATPQHHFFSQKQGCGQIRTATHLPKPFKNPCHSKIIYKAIDATAFWTDLNQRKPSSGRKGDHEVVEGACATLKSDETLLQRALLQSPAAPAPSRREPLR